MAVPHVQAMTESSEDEDSAREDQVITHVAFSREDLPPLENGFSLKRGVKYDVIKQDEYYVTLEDDNDKRGVVEKDKVQVQPKKKKPKKRSAKDRARAGLNEFDPDAIRAGDLNIDIQQIKEKLEDLNVDFMPGASPQELLNLWADAIEFDADAIRADEVNIDTEEIKRKLDELNVGYESEDEREELLNLWADAITMNPAQIAAEARSLKAKKDRVALEANRDLLRDRNDKYFEKIKDKAVIFFHVATGLKTLKPGSGFPLEEGKTYNVIKQDKKYVTLVDEEGNSGVVDLANVDVRPTELDAIIREMLEYRVGNKKFLKRMLRRPSVEQTEYVKSILSPLMKKDKDEEKEEGKLEISGNTTDEDELDRAEIEADNAEYQTLKRLAKFGRKDDLEYEYEEYEVLKTTEDEYIDLLNSKKEMNTTEFDTRITALESRLSELYAAIELREHPFFEEYNWTSLLDFLDAMAVIEKRSVTSTDEEIKVTLQSPAFEAATFYVAKSGVASRLKGIGNVNVKEVWVDESDVEKWYQLPNGKRFNLHDVVEMNDAEGRTVRLVSAYNLAERLRSETRNAIYEYMTAFVQDTGEVEEGSTVVDGKLVYDNEEFVNGLSEVDNAFMRSLKKVQKLYNNAKEIGPDDLPRVSIDGLNRYIEGLKAHAAKFGLPYSIDPTLADIATGALNGETLTRKIRTRDQKVLDTGVGGFEGPDTVDEVLGYVAYLFKRITGQSLPQPDLKAGDDDLIDDEIGVRTRRRIGGSGFKLGDLSSYNKTLPYSEEAAQFNDFEELKLEYATIKGLLRRKKAEAVERWISIVSFGDREDEYQRLVIAGDEEGLKAFPLNNLRPSPKLEGDQWTFFPSPDSHWKDLRKELDQLYQISLKDNIEFQRRVLEGAAKIAADRILGALSAKSVVVVFQRTDPLRDDYATICKYKDPNTRVYIGNVAYIKDSKGKKSLVYVHTVDDLGEDGVRIQFSQDYRKGRGRKGYDYLRDLAEGQEIEILPRIRRVGDTYYDYSDKELDKNEMKNELGKLIDGLVSYPIEEACREFRLHIPDDINEEVEKEEKDIGDTKDDAYGALLNDDTGTMQLTYNEGLQKFTAEGYAISETETEASDAGSEEAEDDRVDRDNVFWSLVRNIVGPAWDLKDDNAEFAAQIQGKPLIKDDDKAALDDIVRAMYNFEVGNETVLTKILDEDAIKPEFYRSNVSRKLTMFKERETALGKIERVLGEKYFEELKRITSADESALVEMSKDQFIEAMIAAQKSIISKEIPENERYTESAGAESEQEGSGDDKSSEDEDEDDEFEILVADIIHMVKTELEDNGSKAIIDDIIERMEGVEDQDDFKEDFLAGFPTMEALFAADEKMILDAFNNAVFGDDADEDAQKDQDKYDSVGDMMIAQLNPVYYAIRAFLGYTMEEEVADSQDLRTDEEALNEEREWLDRRFYGDASKKSEQVSVVGRVDFLLLKPQYENWRCLEYLSPRDDLSPIFRFSLNTDLMNLWSKEWWYENCKYGLGKFSKGNVAIQTPDQLLGCVDSIMTALGALQQGKRGALVAGSKKSDVQEAMFDLIRFTTMLKYFQLALESRIDAVLGQKDHMLDEDSIEYQSWTTTRYDFVVKFLDAIESRIMANPAAFVYFLDIGFGIELTGDSRKEVVANPGLVIYKTMFGGQYLFAAEPQSSKPPPRPMKWWEFEVIGTSFDDIKERLKGLFQDRKLKFKNSKGAKPKAPSQSESTDALDYSQGYPDDQTGAAPGRKRSAGTTGYTDRTAQPTKGHGTCGI